MKDPKLHKRSRKISRAKQPHHPVKTPKPSKSDNKPGKIRKNADKLQRYLKKTHHKKPIETETTTNVQDISPNHMLECNQALSQQRKNFDPLIKHLLSFKYYEQEKALLPSGAIPEEFQDYTHYHRTFYPLMLNEYTAEIHNNLQTLVNQAEKTLPIACKVRICQGDAGIDEDFTSLEVKVIEDEGNDCMVMAQEGHKVNEIFDISFSCYYLLLISSSKEKVSIDQVNNTSSSEEEFCLVGYLNNQGKGSQTKILTTIGDCFKGSEEWTACYIRPIQKISTAIKEYQALNCLVSSDVSQYVFQPKSVSNIPSPTNEGFYNEFLEAIAKEYNSSQLEAIKDVCVSRNGICLLQGPVN